MSEFNHPGAGTQTITSRGFREFTSIACIDCQFFGEQGLCVVPGHVCVFRAIRGVAGTFVGDVLEGAGVIGPGWRQHDAFEINHRLDSDSAAAVVQELRMIRRAVIANLPIAALTGIDHALARLRGESYETEDDIRWAQEQALQLIKEEIG